MSGDRKIFERFQMQSHVDECPLWRWHFPAPSALSVAGSRTAWTGRILWRRHSNDAIERRRLAVGLRSDEVPNWRFSYYDSSFLARCQLTERSHLQNGGQQAVFCGD